MNEDLFNTEDKKTNAILHFEALEVSIGWQLVVKIVKQNIEVLKKQLMDGVEGETKEDIQRLRDKIKDHENFINTPHDMMEKLGATPAKQENDDPYDQPDEKKE